LLLKFPGLAISGSHNCNNYKCRKLTAEWSPYAMSIFHFYRSVSLRYKSRRSKTANIKILFANFTHRS